MLDYSDFEEMKDNVFLNLQNIASLKIYSDYDVGSQTIVKK